MVEDVKYVFETETSDHPIGYMNKKNLIKTFPKDIRDGFIQCYTYNKSQCAENIQKCVWINKKKPFPERCIYKGEIKDKNYKNFLDYWNYKLKE